MERGLSINCSAQEKKVWCRGKMLHFIVGIAYNRGVVLWEQYHKPFTGECFANFVRTHFDNAFYNTFFNNTQNPSHKLFLQDGNPRPNFKKANKAIEEIGA